PLVVSAATAVIGASVISRTAVSAVVYTIAFPLGALGAQRAGLGRGSVNGLLTLASGVANAVGPLAAGVIAETLGGRWAAAMRVAVCFAAAAWFVLPGRLPATDVAVGPRVA